MATHELAAATDGALATQSTKQKPKAADSRRFQVLLPDELLAEMQAIASREHTSVVEILRRYIKLGLLIDRVNRDGGKFLIRENNIDREVLMV